MENAYELVFRSHEGERTVSLDSTVVVGRDPAVCDVAIKSDRLSRRHAEFSFVSDGVLVRDLGSTNGITLNGQRMAEGRLQPGDRVVLGDVGVTVRVKGAPSGTDPASSEPAPPSPASHGEPTLGPPRSVKSVDRPPMVLRPAPATPPLGPDGTTLRPRMAEVPAVEARTARRPGALGVEPPRPEPASVESRWPARAGSARPGRGRRFGFTLRVVALALLGVASIFAVTAVPLVVVQRGTAARFAVIHAASIARKLVADVRPALVSGEVLSVSVRSVLVEPGVRSALVLTPGGRVLAPPERLEEAYPRLPAFGDVNAITGLQTAQSGDAVEAVAVIEAGGQRAGLVWITFDPNYALESRRALRLVLLASLAITLALGLALALLIRRMVNARLEAFDLDLDMALGGGSGVLVQRYGLPALARPIESLNYAIERLSRGATPAGVVAPAGPRPPSPVQAPARSAGGVLTLDASFVVQTADACVASLLGRSVEDLVGRHVLEVATDRTLIDVVIDCVGGLNEAPSVTRRVVASATGVVEVSATRGAGGVVVLSLRGSDAPA